ncbi:MAG: prepilin peptidase [Opitutales bacterium]|nr:prepilin peptidase [Opitutales bacterium]
MITAWIFVFGACIGSFLNVVIYRLPRGESVVHPRSHCRCGVPIAWYDNIPILSWFILRGRCRHCKEAFSFRYPLVELGTALVFVGLWHSQPFLPSLAFMAFACGMIAAAVIDWDTMEIPDRFSIGGMLLGLLLSAFIPEIHGIVADQTFAIGSLLSLTQSLQGALLGSGLMLWIAVIAEKVLGKEAMGFGDVKLMGAIGAFCGWQGAVFALFGGAFIGLALLLPYLLINKSKDASRPTLAGLRMPFGPALVLGSLLYLIFFQPYVDAYFEPFQNLFN